MADSANVIVTSGGAVLRGSEAVIQPAVPAPYDEDAARPVQFTN